MARTSKEELSSREYIASIWARNHLAYDLIDDPMFRQQFGPNIPPSFDRRQHSDEMKSLATKITSRMFQKLGKCVATLGVDGWTNTRHHKMYNVVLTHDGRAYFLDSVETRGNSGDEIYTVVHAAKHKL